MTVMQVDNWLVTSNGLAYDRMFTVVSDDNSVCMTQKRLAKLCKLQPRFDLDRNTMVLTYKGKPHKLTLFYPKIHDFSIRIERLFLFRTTGVPNVFKRTHKHLQSTSSHKNKRQKVTKMQRIFQPSRFDSRDTFTVCCWWIVGTTQRLGFLIFSLDPFVWLATSREVSLASSLCFSPPPPFHTCCNLR